MNVIKEKVWTVTELTLAIKDLLQTSFPNIVVEGELTDIRSSFREHFYFTLKDDNAAIKGVMFASDLEFLTFKPENGQHVRVYGRLTVYQKRGDYQIVAYRIEQIGTGLLYKKFLELKEQLMKEGLFDESRKKSLPLLPMRIGIVTSPDGAAIRDILKILSRKRGNVYVLIAPARVQGEGAAEQIAEGIDLLNSLNKTDVIIVTRGGGSIEDLWPFNEEIVARAIARSRIPVISAVGHQIDFTISDFVADIRAPTPSAAAEMIVKSKEEFIEKLDKIRETIFYSVRDKILTLKSRLNEIRASQLFNKPVVSISVYRIKVENLRKDLIQGIQSRFNEMSQRLDETYIKFLSESNTWLRFMKMKLENLGIQMKALDPMDILKRGYSISFREDGRILRSVNEVETGQKILTRLYDGRVYSKVNMIQLDLPSGDISSK